MDTYPGIPGPELTDFLSRATSEERFGAIRMHIGKVCMIANTGTYVDVPFHFYEDGQHLGEVGIDRLADLPAVFSLVVAPHWWELIRSTLTTWATSLVLRTVGCSPQEYQSWNTSPGWSSFVP